MNTGTRQARLKDETHRTLSRLANGLNTSMTAVLHLAVERLARQAPEVVRRSDGGRYKKRNIRTALKAVVCGPDGA